MWRGQHYDVTYYKLYYSTGPVLYSKRKRTPAYSVGTTKSYVQYYLYSTISREPGATVEYVRTVVLLDKASAPIGRDRPARVDMSQVP